jgi:Leucine-rich repeat (LRR) protein
MTNLNTLNFGDNDIKQIGIASLAPSLVSMKNLITLDLGCNSIEATGIALLAPCLAMMTNLTSLDLRGNNITDVEPSSLEQLRYFVDWYDDATSMNRETELTKIDVETVASMTAYIGTMKQVITLDTRDLGLKSLAHSLVMMTNLRSLDLSYNNIYDLSIYPSDVSVLEPIFMAIEHLTFLNPQSWSK